MTSNSDDINQFFAQWQQQWTQIMTQPETFQDWQKTMMEMAKTYAANPSFTPASNEESFAATSRPTHDPNSDVLEQLTKRLECMEERLTAIEQKLNKHKK